MLYFSEAVVSNATVQHQRREKIYSKKLDIN